MCKTRGCTRGRLGRRDTRRKARGGGSGQGGGPSRNRVARRRSWRGGGVWHTRGAAPRQSAGRLGRYNRSVDLPRLLPLWPRELADLSLEAHKTIVARLRSALRAERRRGQCGHWTYDLSRHAALLDAYRQEVAMLKVREREAANKCGGPEAAADPSRD